MTTMGFFRAITVGLPELPNGSAEPSEEFFDDSDTAFSLSCIGEGAWKSPMSISTVGSVMFSTRNARRNVERERGRTMARKAELQRSRKRIRVLVEERMGRDGTRSWGSGNEGCTWVPCAGKQMNALYPWCTNSSLPIVFTSLELEFDRCFLPLSFIAFHCGYMPGIRVWRKEIDLNLVPMCGWMTIGNQAINFLFNQIHLAITPPRLTRVIHPPPPVLVVLSIGWAAFLHPVPDPALTNIASQSVLWSFFFEGCFFSQPWPHYLSS
jgi:hypothetical protein